MRRSTFISLTLLFVVALLTACQRGTTEAGQGVEYAALLNVERADSFTRVDVRDAWHADRLLHTYILVPQASPLPTALPEGTLLRTPLTRLVIGSSVHASLLCDLGAKRSIVGLCDTAYILHPELRADLRAGKIASMGAAYSPDLERLVSVKPDAMLVSPMEGSNYGALERADIPLIECADYMETSALGRAEWMKFFGLLVGRETVADSLFTAITTAYDSLRTAATADTTAKRPQLMVDVKQGDAWYVPGGHSYLGGLYADAGADYVFKDNAESGSVAYSAEKVLTAAATADVWLIKYGQATDITYASLASDNNLYTRFRPWQEHRIYGCNTLRVPFYEEAPFHPDRLLRDLVRIFHPEVLKAHELRYFTPIH